MALGSVARTGRLASGFTAGNFAAFWIGGIAVALLMGIGYLVSTQFPAGIMVAEAVFAFGLVAFGLLTLSVWLGLGMSTRLLGPKRQKRLLGLHRTLAWTGLSMVGLHLGAVLLDPVLHFGVLGALIPGVANWRPGAAGWLSTTEA